MTRRLLIRRTFTRRVPGRGQRSRARERFLHDLFVTAIENYGYGFFAVEDYSGDVAPREAYAVIVDPEEPAKSWRVDIDTMAKGLSVIRNARQVARDGETFRVNAKGERLYFGGRVRTDLLKAERTNGADGDCDVIGALAVLECALFGRVVYA
jgi:hypothetical protein